MKPLVRFGLGVAGMPEATINEIDQALPALERLIDFEKQLSSAIVAAYPDLVAAIPAIQRLLITAKQLEPIITKAYPDLVLVLPVLKDIIEFVQTKEGT
jgi:hypothetical protein